MKSDENFLNDTVEEFLAALPPEDLVEHSRNVVRNYIDSNSQNISDLKWVEYDSKGVPLRGGISSAESMSTRLLSNWDEDADIRHLVDHSNQNTIKVGELIAAKGPESYFWIIPFRPTHKTAKPENGARAILLNENLLSQIVDLFNEEACLTPAEKRVVFQVLVGQNPPVAAKQDNVSPETKRSQLKAATTKLDCSGQSSLIRLIVSQMIHLLYVCEAETSHMHLIEKFTTRFFGENARLLAQRLSNGKLVRYWEFGPRHGQPILVMHGYLFPFLVLNSDKELARQNIRLMFPLRTGFLDSQSPSGVLGIETLAEENLENFELFAELIDEKMPILGHNMGAVYAMILARRKPHLFTRVISASVNLMQEKEERPSIASKFTGTMRKLASDIGIYEMAVQQFQKAALMNNRITKIVLRRLFKDSPHDLSVIDSNHGKGDSSTFEWFREIALNSVLGISSDLALISRDIERTIGDVPIPLHFLHAPDDPYTSLEELHELASYNPNSTTTVLEAGGHYVSASHPEDFWQAVSLVMEQ